MHAGGRRSRTRRALFSCALLCAPLFVPLVGCGAASAGAHPRPGRDNEEVEDERWVQSDVVDGVRLSAGGGDALCLDFSRLRDDAHLAPQIAAAETFWVDEGPIYAATVELPDQEEQRAREAAERRAAEGQDAPSSRTEAGSSLPPAVVLLVHDVTGDPPTPDHARSCGKYGDRAHVPVPDLERGEAVFHCMEVHRCRDRRFLIEYYRPPRAGPATKSHNRSFHADVVRIDESIGCVGDLPNLHRAIGGSALSLNLEPARIPCNLRVDEADPALMVLAVGDRQRTPVLRAARVPSDAPQLAGRVRGEVRSSGFDRRLTWEQLPGANDQEPVLYHREREGSVTLDLMAWCGEAEGERHGCSEERSELLQGAGLLHGAELRWLPEFLWLARVHAGALYLIERDVGGIELGVDVPVDRIARTPFSVGFAFSVGRFGQELLVTVNALIEVDLSFLWRHEVGGRARAVQLALGLRGGLGIYSLYEDGDNYYEPGIDLSPYLEARLMITPQLFLPIRATAGWIVGARTTSRVSAETGLGVLW